MRKLITLLFVIGIALSSEAQSLLQQKILPGKMATSAPRGVADGATQEYLNMKLGAMICFNINAFIGNNLQMFSRLVQHPSKFDLADFNAKAIAQQMAATGKIKYCYLTVTNEMGFSLYPSEVYNDAPSISITGYTQFLQLPAFRTYSVKASANADQNIIGKFFTEFKKVGIEPGLYFNIEGGYNHTGRAAASTYTGSDTNLAYLRHVQLQTATLMYEIFSKYPFKYAWFDTDPAYPLNDDLFYNAIKTASPRTMITHNSYANTGFQFFPYDIKSIEYYVAPADGNAIYNTSQTYQGNTYYVPKEVITTVFQNEQYSAVNPAYLYDQPSYTVDQLHTPTEMQAIYNKGFNNSANVTFAVAADRLGVVSQAQIDLIANVSLTGSTILNIATISGNTIQTISGNTITTH